LQLVYNIFIPFLLIISNRNGFCIYYLIPSNRAIDTWEIFVRTYEKGEAACYFSFDKVFSNIITISYYFFLSAKTGAEQNHQSLCPF